MILRTVRKTLNDHLAALCATNEGFERACFYTWIIQTVGSVVIYGALLTYLE